VTNQLVEAATRTTLWTNTSQVSSRDVFALRAFTNVSGCGSAGYQADVSDEGNNDKIVNNSISGPGYADNNASGCGTFSIDATFAARAKIHAHNTGPWERRIDVHFEIGLRRETVMGDISLE